MWRFGFVTLVATALAIPARAERLPQFATDAEYRNLPVVCRPERLLNTLELQVKAQVRDRLGEKVALHLRHYCNGLNNLARAQVTFNKKDKRLYLTRAVHEFEYCLGSWPKDGLLNGEAETKKRQAEALLAAMDGGERRR